MSKLSAFMKAVPSGSSAASPASIKGTDFTPAAGALPATALVVPEVNDIALELEVQ